MRAILCLPVALLVTGGCRAPSGASVDTDVSDSDVVGVDTDGVGDTDPGDTDDTDTSDTDTSDTHTSDTDALDTDVADTDDTGVPSTAFRVRITPAHPKTGDDLVAVVENIPPGTGTPFIVWSEPGSLAVFGDTVSHDLTHKGETWTVSAIMIAATGIPEVTATAEILNTAPVVTSVAVVGVPSGACGVLTCVVETADADGDAMVVTQTWTVDAQAAGTGPSLGGFVLSGQVVGCLASASDGDTSVGVSDTQTILDPSLTDADSDGLCTAQETALHTSDNNTDSDGDGRSDAEEVFLDGTDPAVAP